MDEEDAIVPPTHVKFISEPRKAQPGFGKRMVIIGSGLVGKTKMVLNTSVTEIIPEGAIVTHVDGTKELICSDTVSVPRACGTTMPPGRH